MPVPYYPGSLVTPNLGLSLVGMEVELAENFIILDTAIGGGGGGGTTVRVNGSVVNNPNFNNTTPAAPAGNINVTFQVTGSSISAYVPTGGGGAPGGLNTELQFNNSGAFGGTSGLDWDVPSSSVSGSFAFNPFSNIESPVFIDQSTAVLSQGDNTPFCGASTGSSAGTYFWKYAVSDATTTLWSNVASGSFVVSTGAGTDYFEIIFDPFSVPDINTDLGHVWISTDGGVTYQEVTNGCDAPYAFVGGFFIDGTITFVGGLPVPTGSQLDTLLVFPAVVPLYIRDINGDLHEQAFIDVDTTSTGSPASGPPGPDGTLTFTRRVWWRDNGAATQGGKNAYISVNHLAGTTTVQTNQDRAVFVNMINDVSNPDPIYGMESINATMTVAGNPSFLSVVDGEASVLSVQMNDAHTGVVPAPNFGVNCARMTYFRNGSGTWGSINPSIMNLLMLNNSTGAGGGMALQGIGVTVFDTTGAPVTTDGIAINIGSPLTGRLTHNTGLLIGNFGTNTNDKAINVVGGFVNLGPQSTTVGSLVIPGSSTGSATIQVAAAAGTPNPLQLPTTTGTSGQALVTDGNNPQQLSWATVSGTPSVVAAVNQVGQTASIGTANIVASALAGVYRISYYMKITTAGSTSGSVTLTLSYTDEDDSTVITYVVPTPANATDSTSVVSGTLIVDAKVSTAITYATTYASVGGTAMVYKLRLKAEKLF